MDLLTQASEIFHMGTWVREGTVRSSRGGLQRERNHSHYTCIFSTGVWKGEPSPSKLQWWLKIFNIFSCWSSPSSPPWRGGRPGAGSLKHVWPWPGSFLQGRLQCKSYKALPLHRYQRLSLTSSSTSTVTSFSQFYSGLLSRVYVQEDKASPPLSFFLVFFFFFKQTLCHD